MSNQFETPIPIQYQGDRRQVYQFTGTASAADFVLFQADKELVVDSISVWIETTGGNATAFLNNEPDSTTSASAMVTSQAVAAATLTELDITDNNIIPAGSFVVLALSGGSNDLYVTVCFRYARK